MARDVCHGKRRFRDKGEALEALRLIERRESHGRKRQRIPKRAYACSTCNGWHLTAKSVEEYAEEYDAHTLPPPPPLPQPKLPRRRCKAAQKLRRRHGRPRGR